MNKLKKRILAYSAKKNKAKAMPLYSTLKPLTNSDSLSAKSKGALFVSATPVTINIKDTGTKGPIRDPLWVCSILMSNKLKEPSIHKKLITSRPKLTS
jgi:hypothetical protein